MKIKLSDKHTEYGLTGVYPCRECVQLLAEYHHAPDAERHDDDEEGEEEVHEVFASVTESGGQLIHTPEKKEVIIKKSYSSKIEPFMLK